jgi:hypothetical protein
MKVFSITNDTMVMTTSYVTTQRLPILYVAHQDDEEGGSLWQFHCDNGDYSQDKLQLVRLDTILKLDPAIAEIADLPIGSSARRKNPTSPWLKGT